MNRKPDIIRAIVIIFAVGLVITGFTSFNAPRDGLSAAANAYVSEVMPAPEARNRN